MTINFINFIGTEIHYIYIMFLSSSFHPYTNTSKLHNNEIDSLLSHPVRISIKGYLSKVSDRIAPVINIASAVIQSFPVYKNKNIFIFARSDVMHIANYYVIK